MILINYKIYKETFGEKAIELARIIKKVQDKFKIRIVITASALDVIRIKNEGVEVWLQDVDEYYEGKHTGWISAKQAMALGINGSLINHYEKQKKKGTILKTIKSRPDGFEIMCCAKSVGQIEWMDRCKPDYILYEPPEFIGSSTDSVASKPESIKKVSELISKSQLIVGAGVKTRDDVITSLKMGAVGVGLASGIVLSSNPEKVLTDIAEGFNSV